MKIIIETPRDGEEEEVILRCRTLDDSLIKLLERLKNPQEPINGHLEGRIVRLEPKDIFYFESVEGKVFAYTAVEVYEIHRKLYEVEEVYGDGDFLRISKSIIVNVSKISYVKPTFNGRFEARLKNQETVMISRQYVADLKKKLGM
ncbi:MAG: LytTR family transcriptional regulator [Firmicutes bacterium]|nr:LytTR family transcriptional regulator [Bacillota bacterium]